MRINPAPFYYVEKCWNDLYSPVSSNKDEISASQKNRSLVDNKDSNSFVF